MGRDTRDNWIEFLSLIQEDTEESSCPTSHGLLLQSWACPPFFVVRPLFPRPLQLSAGTDQAAQQKKEEFMIVPCYGLGD